MNIKERLEFLGYSKVILGGNVLVVNVYIKLNKKGKSEIKEII